MSIVRDLLVAVVGLSTILGGMQSLLAGTTAPGIVRTHEPDRDAACETNSSASGSAAEADDGEDDASHDHDWDACGPMHAALRPSVGGALDGTHPDTTPPRPRRTTDVIRGPPARG